MAVVSGMSSLTYCSRNFVIMDDFPDFFSPTKMKVLLVVVAIDEMIIKYLFSNAPTF